ncbi:MAG TPA: EF-hand domain-containing protein [Allosphingosinicella sp.]|nr:EF-hand domain-containing protein [Allosphingosinicella sp.]
MRPLLPFALLLASTTALAQAPQPPAAPAAPDAGPHEGRWGGVRRPHGSVFLSPMGEPFRSDDVNADNVGAWFAQADRNHDGAITMDEMQADAARFFETLDTDHDGEIDPTEIARYETEIAPEVQVGTQMGERARAGRGGGGGGGGWGGGRRGGGGGGGRGGWGGGGRGRGGSGGQNGEGAQSGLFEEGLEGAGRYSFINIPEPVISADADLNRGVSKAEFADAAAKRFAMLDANHDGRLTRDELPALPQRHSGKHKHKGPDIKPEREPLPL